MMMIIPRRQRPGLLCTCLAILSLVLVVSDRATDAASSTSDGGIVSSTSTAETGKSLLAAIIDESINEISDDEPLPEDAAAKREPFNQEPEEEEEREDVGDPARRGYAWSGAAKHRLFAPVPTLASPTAQGAREKLGKSSLLLVSLIRLETASAPPTEGTMQSICQVSGLFCCCCCSSSLDTNVCCMGRETHKFTACQMKRGHRARVR